MTQPKPGSGHLPPGTVGALAGYHLPGLDQIISDATHDLAKALATLRRNFDPMSAEPAVEEYIGVLQVDVHLARTVHHIKEALEELQVLADLYPPPPLMFSARRTPASGGPSFHPDPMPGVGRSPGCAAELVGAACGSDGAAIPEQATSHPDSSPGCGRTPGLVVVAAPVAAGGGSLGVPEAGASPDPRRLPASTRGNGHATASRREPSGVGHEPDRPTSPGLPPTPGDRPRWSAWADLAETRPR